MLFRSAYSTAEFKVNLMRPITPKTGEVVCEGRVLHRGRTLAVSEATLKDAAGKLLAFGTETSSPVGAAGAAGAVGAAGGREGES